MSREILLFGAAREQSTRCHNKMLRPFAGTTLYDIYLNRLWKLQASGLFSRVVIAVAECDEGLWMKAHASGLEVVERSAASVAQGISRRADELHFLDRFDESHAMFVNACIPMFSLGLIKDMVLRFRTDTRVVSMTLRHVEHNWFYREDGSPVNNSDPHCLSTQGCPPLLSAVHAANIYPRERMLRESMRNALTTDDDPRVMVVDPPRWQLMDIDTEEDFARCEREWAERAGRGVGDDA